MRVLEIGLFVLTIIAAAPASAQLTRAAREFPGSTHAPIRGDIRLPAPVNPTLGRSTSVSREVRDIRDDIDAGRRAGQLSRGEARALRREGYRIESMRARFAQGGYTEAEVALLRGRTEALRSATVAKRTQGVQGK